MARGVLIPGGPWLAVVFPLLFIRLAGFVVIGSLPAPLSVDPFDGSLVTWTPFVAGGSLIIDCHGCGTGSQGFENTGK